MAGQIRKQKRLDGSIIEDSWLVRIFLGRESDGKRKYYSKTIHGTKHDAQKFLNAKLREKDLGIFVEPASMHLNDYLDRWLRDVAKQKLSERTFENYEALLKSHIRGKIGSKRLSDLQAYDIQKLYKEMNDAGYSSRTVRHAHTVLSSALKQAVRWRLIFQNPCDLCELPKLVKAEMKCFTLDEVKRFLETAKTSKHYTLFLLAIQTGMRPEEYLGLQWKDIDLDKKVLSVRRALIARKGGGYYFADTKTKKSQRSIDFQDTLVSELRRHRRDQLEQKMKLGADYENLDLVFCTNWGSPLDHSNLAERIFKGLRDEANVSKIRLYDLRHTTATLMLASGENPKIVAERLGHSSIVLTLTPIRTSCQLCKETRPTG